MINQLVADRRLGKFKISEFVFETTDAKTLLNLMGNFVIVRAENIYIERCIKYHAYSPLFGVTDACDKIPEYEIHLVNDGTIVTVEIKE